MLVLPIFTLFPRFPLSATAIHSKALTETNDFVSRHNLRSRVFLSLSLSVYLSLCVFLFHLCLPVSLSFSVFFTTSICAPDCLTFLFACLCLSFSHCFSMIWFSFLCLSVCVFANVDLFRKSEQNNAPLQHLFHFQFFSFIIDSHLFIDDFHLFLFSWFHNLAFSL